MCVKGRCGDKLGTRKSSGTRRLSAIRPERFPAGDVLQVIMPANGLNFKCKLLAKFMFPSDLTLRLDCSVVSRVSQKTGICKLGRLMEIQCWLIKL